MCVLTVEDCQALLDERTCVCAWPGCGQKLGQPAALSM